MMRRLGSRVAYQNAWMTVREDTIELADGSESVYGVVEKPTYALIVAVHHGDVILVRQYRYPIDAWSIEFPQGTASSPDRSPEETAVSELREETGFRARRMQSIGHFHHGVGYSTQEGHVFLAQDLTEGPQQLDATEQGMEVVRWPVSKVDDEIARGTITDVATIAAWHLTKPYVEALRP